MSEYRVISSDSHIVEPPDLWLDRMDPRYSDRIPHIVNLDHYDQWFCDHQSIGSTGSALGAGLRFSSPQDISLEAKFDDAIPGGYDPHARIHDMDLDGIGADVIYSSIAGVMYKVEDPDLMRSVFAAYNDWLADFCAPYPNRLKGIGQILLDDNMDAGLAELNRIVKLGLCGTMIPLFPRVGESYDHPTMYEPLWASAQALNIPLSLHIGTRRPGSHTLDAEGKIIQKPSDRSTTDYWIRMSLADLIFSGVFERYPDLRVVNVEHDASWVPYFMFRMDTTYRDRHFQATYRFKGDTLPSDFMRSNVYHSFQEDGLGIRLRDIIGVDKIMWGSDYPHTESTFPRSQEILAEILEGVPEKEKAMIVGGNCARLYGIN